VIARSFPPLRMALVCVMMLATPVAAVEPSEMLTDPVLEARARDLSAGLRCLICRNQNIDDSNSELARDLRLVLRERLVAGDTNDEAVAYMVDRYGNYILLKPPFNPSTMLLWFGPGLMLVAALLGFRSLWSGQSKSPNRPDDLSDDDRVLIAQALASKDAQ
jgi:cytochrome c-type biogenesis protein CcmH